MGKTEKIVGAMVQAPDRFDDLAHRIADINTKVDLTEKNLREQINGLSVDWFMKQLCEDRGLLNEMNGLLSMVPTVWGDRNRLEIDETAKVFTCFFNTNSGRIRVGAYTFAGSGVSLLAGTHDPALAGALRRDLEKTDGCDIDIGQGVWLASGCTVLGPCVIGDNAVIAAGAVVVPGTEVPANTVWGGVPARQLKELDLQAAADHPAVRAALGKNGGLLYTEGWGESIPNLLDIPGHWMCKREAALLADRKEWLLKYCREGIEGCVIRLEGPAGTAELDLEESEGERVLSLPVSGNGPEEVRLRKDGDAKVFMALRPLRDPEQAKRENAVSEAPEEGVLDIEAIMEEIRAEARKAPPAEGLPEFDRIRVRQESPVEALAREVKDMTDGYGIPPVIEEKTGNPVKRLYKKITCKAVRCATVPLSSSVTEANLRFKTALEKTVAVMECQQREIEELKDRIWNLER